MTKEKYLLATYLATLVAGFFVLFKMAASFYALSIFGIPIIAGVFFGLF